MARGWSARRECALLMWVLVIGAVAAIAPVPVLGLLVILTGPQVQAWAWCFVLGFGASLLAASDARQWLPGGVAPTVR